MDTCGSMRDVTLALRVVNLLNHLLIFGKIYSVFLDVGEDTTHFASYLYFTRSMS